MLLQRTLTILEEQRAAGWHPGAQLYVSLNGEPIADLAIGLSRENVPLTQDTLMAWLSACKPVAAVAIALLWERGRCGIDDPVAKHLPAFAQNGKQRVTLRHVLTHTGGFPTVNTNWPRSNWEEILATICAAPLLEGSIPGRTAQYHVQSGWFVLGELVRLLDEKGRTYDRFVRDEIFQPLGMNDCWIGMPVDRFRAYGERIAVIHNTEKSPPRPDPLYREERITSCAPGSNGYGPVRELAHFYEMLRAQGTREGKRLLAPQTVAALSARHRTGMFDQTFKHVIDWGLGFICNSNLYGAETVPYGFGRHSGPRTFGHSGNQSSCAFCDPDAGLVVAWACNGQPGEKKHNERARAINAAIYEDLSLA